MAGVKIATSFRSPYPFALPLVSGRFYDSSLNNGALTTGATKNNLYAIPFLIPAPITITAIGVETTIAASAGSLARLGVYKTDDDNWYPHVLVLDAGTIAIDAAAGFQSVSISLEIESGWHWFCLAQDNPATAATYRFQQAGNSLHVMSPASPGIPANAIYNVALYAGGGAGAVAAGFPRFFNYDAIGSSSNAPRLMIGV